MEHHYDTAEWIKMSLTLSSGMAVDDLPDVTEPPRDGMSIHEVKQGVAWLGHRFSQGYSNSKEGVLRAEIHSIPDPVTFSARTCRRHKHSEGHDQGGKSG